MGPWLQDFGLTGTESNQDRSSSSTEAGMLVSQFSGLDITNEGSTKGSDNSRASSLIPLFIVLKSARTGLSAWMWGIDPSICRAAIIRGL